MTDLAEKIQTGSRKIVRKADSNEETENANEIDDFRCLFEGRWSRVIIDEAHSHKNPSSRNFFSVALCKSPFHVFVSGTPTPNRVKDLVAYLKLLQPEKVSEDEDWASAADTGGKYGVIQWYKNNSTDAKVLNPLILKYMMDKGNLSVDHAAVILPIIYDMILLKRARGDVIQLSEGNKVVVGDEVAPYQIFQCRLMPRQYERSLYARVFNRCQAEIVSGGKDSNGESEGRFNMGVVRNLAHVSNKLLISKLSEIPLTDILQASFLPALNQLSITVREEMVGKKRNGIADSAQNVHSWANKDDMGIEFLLDHIIANPLMPPGIAESTGRRVQTIALNACKLRYATGILNFHCSLRGEKVLIVAQWPAIAWVTQVYCSAIGFNVLAINSSMNDTERAEIVRRWNDPTDLSQILIATTTVIAFGHNLHEGGCNVIIVMDCPNNYATLLQLVARINRLGQVKKQFIYNLFQYGTLDEYRHANATFKNLGIISSSGLDAFSKQFTKLAKDAEATSGATIGTATSASMELDFKNAVLEVIRRMTGAPSHCLHSKWLRIKDSGLDENGVRHRDRDDQ